MRDQKSSNREAELPAPTRIGSGDWLGIATGIINKMKIPVYFETESRGEHCDNRRKFTAKSDGTNPEHECDDIYVGDGKCVCWRCGKESMLAAMPNTVLYNPSAKPK